MKVLIIKLGASGDVVRTTPLLRKFTTNEVHWVTEPTNVEILPPAENLRVFFA